VGVFFNCTKHTDISNGFLFIFNVYIFIDLKILER
jgi:hypothetical protein